jgi:hypothetical protein
MPAMQEINFGMLLCLDSFKNFELGENTVESILCVSSGNKEHLFKERSP